MIALGNRSDRADEIGSEYGARLVVGLERLDLTINTDHGALARDASKTQQRATQKTTVNASIRPRVLDPNLDAIKICRLVAGRPARNMHERPRAGGPQPKGDAVRTRTDGRRPDDARSVDAQLVTINAYPGRHNRPRCLDGALRMHRQEVIDGAQQHEFAGDTATVNLGEHVARQCVVCAIPKGTGDTKAKPAAPPRLAMPRIQRTDRETRLFHAVVVGDTQLDKEVLPVRRFVGEERVPLVRQRCHGQKRIAEGRWVTRIRANRRRASAASSQRDEVRRALVLRARDAKYRDHLQTQLTAFEGIACRQANRAGDGELARTREPLRDHADGARLATDRARDHLFDGARHVDGRNRA